MNVSFEISGAKFIVDLISVVEYQGFTFYQCLKPYELKPLANVTFIGVSVNNANGESQLMLESKTLLGINDFKVTNVEFVR